MTDGHHHLERDRARVSRGWIDITDDRQVLVAPLLSFLAFVLLAVGDQSIAMRLLALLVQIALFQIVVTAHIRRPRLRRLLLVAAPIALIVLLAGAGTIAYEFDVGTGKAITSFLSAGLAIGVIIRVFGRVARAPVINGQVVIDAIAVYLMIGLTFAYVYLAFDAMGDRDFFNQGPQAVTVFLYFSFITLATVGYGDFTPAHTAGQMTAMAEGLLGQLYLVTVLALIVSNLGRTRDPLRTRPGRPAEPDGSSDADRPERSD
jgi:hypothetical protein